MLKFKSLGKDYRIPLRNWNLNAIGLQLDNESDYRIPLRNWNTIQSASDVSAVGDTVVYDKQANGFKIKVTGSADNIQIRWTLMNPNLK